MDSFCATTRPLFLWRIADICLILRSTCKEAALTFPYRATSSSFFRKGWPLRDLFCRASQVYLHLHARIFDVWIDWENYCARIHVVDQACLAARLFSISVLFDLSLLSFSLIVSFESSSTILGGSTSRQSHPHNSPSTWSRVRAANVSSNLYNTPRVIHKPIFKSDYTNKIRSKAQNRLPFAIQFAQINRLRFFCIFSIPV